MLTPNLNLHNNSKLLPTLNLAIYNFYDTLPNIPPPHPRTTFLGASSPARARERIRAFVQQEDGRYHEQPILKVVWSSRFGTPNILTSSMFEFDRILLIESFSLLDLSFLISLLSVPFKVRNPQSNAIHSLNSLSYRPRLSFFHLKFKYNNQLTLDASGK